MVVTNKTQLKQFVAAGGGYAISLEEATPEMIKALNDEKFVGGYGNLSVFYLFS